MERATVTAHVPAYNSPDLFLKCVSHLLWVDELIVADNSNTDSVKDVIPLIGHKNVKYVRTEETDIRLRLLQLKDQVQSDYILWVHTDEFYSEEASKEILAVLADKENLKDGYIIPSKSYVYFEYIGKGNDQLRLFRKDSFYFDLRSIHEMPKVNGSSTLLLNGYAHYNSPTFSSQVPKIFSYAQTDFLLLNDEELAMKRTDKLSSFEVKVHLFKILLKILWRSKVLFLNKNASFAYLWMTYVNLVNIIAKDVVPTEMIRSREGKTY